MKDTNYAPLDFAGVHGTPGKPIRVEVIPGFDQWRIERSDQPDGQLYFPPPDLRVVSDVIKFSGSSYIDVRVHGILPGGKEDCVDANNGSHDITVYADFWSPTGKFAITAKGGSRRLWFHGKLLRHAAEADVDVGNHSDQSPERTREVFLELKPEAGIGPITVRILHGHLPTLVQGSGPYKVDDRLKGVFRRLWAFLKKLKLA